MPFYYCNVYSTVTRRSFGRYAIHTSEVAQRRCCRRDSALSSTQLDSLKTLPVRCKPTVKLPLPSTRVRFVFDSCSARVRVVLGSCSAPTCTRLLCGSYAAPMGSVYGNPISGCARYHQSYRSVGDESRPGGRLDCSRKQTCVNLAPTGLHPVHKYPGT